MKKTQTKTLETQTTELLKAAGHWETMEDLIVQEVEGAEVIFFSLAGGKEEIKELLWFWTTSPLLESAYPSLEINIETTLSEEPIILITQNLNIGFYGRN
jgi:hypothetical protein